MKTRQKRDARLLVLFALLAVLPVGMWACDAGDGPGGPTGPSAQYNPATDYSSATVTAVANKSTVGPGETFTVIATFKDANGLPVEGVPISLSAEMGAADKFFNYPTSHSITDGSGKASLSVEVDASCPEGSYRFVVRSPQAKGYLGISVTEEGATPMITGVELTTTTPTVVGDTPASFIATASATSSCTVRFQYQASGPGVSFTWTDAPAGATNPWLFNVTPDTVTTASTLTVQVAAYCNETGEGEFSDPLNVTVNPVP